MTIHPVLEKLKGGLIVSCQALEDEPLHSAMIMSRMAYAAMQGGAVGIRANSIVDIVEIKKLIDIPLIGIIKRVYPDSSVYISPTRKEIDTLVQAGVEIIATDCTARIRPNGQTLDAFFKEVRQRYPHQLFMADCATVEEGIHAAELGFDCIGTTLSGYTDATKHIKPPHYEMIKTLSMCINKPVIAEGGIWCPEDLQRAFHAGAFAAVVGTAITRTRELTKHYVEALS